VERQRKPSEPTDMHSPIATSTAKKELTIPRKGVVCR
jgi:hypothetical protein